MQANKNGFYYVLDRRHRRSSSRRGRLRTVTWAKGIDPGNRPAHRQSGGLLRHRGDHDLRRAPAARTTGRRCRSTRRPAWSTFRPHRPAATPRSRSIRISRTCLADPIRADSAAIAAPHAQALPAIGPTAPEGQRGSAGRMGSRHAKRTMANRRRRRHWRRHDDHGGQPRFQVINDGRLMAYSADKGEKLLEVQTGLRGGMGPPITFMLDGKQHVALMGGLGQVVAAPAGGGAAAGARGAEPVPPDIAGAAAQAQAGQRANAPAACTGSKRAASQSAGEATITGAHVGRQRNASGSELGILKLDKSCISDPKSEIAN